MTLSSLALPACPQNEPFRCVEDSQCNVENGGVCEVEFEHCSYPDNDCESGYRFSGNAEDLADTCVPVLDRSDPRCGTPLLDDGTAIGALAAALGPGEWALLDEGSQDLVDALEAVAGDTLVVANSSEAKWNSETAELLFVGGDGNDASRLVRYRAAEDTWFATAIPLLADLADPGETYAYLALDEERQRLYHGHRTYDLGAEAVDSRMRLPDARFANDAYDYVPGFGLAAYQGGRLSVLAEDREFWQTVATVEAVEALWPVMVHAPRHERLVFGGGIADPRRLWTMDPSQSVAELPAAPMVTGIASAGDEYARMTIEPRSGDLLVIDTDRSLWVLDPSGGGADWSQVTADLSDQLDPQSRVVLAPLDTYGVVLLLGTSYDEPPWERAWIYRHC